MRAAPNLVASGLFVCSALGPIGVWLVLLLVGMPEGQSRLQAASQMLAFAFFESQGTWLFTVLAVLPLVFLFLAVAAWRAPASAWRLTSGLTMLAVAGIVAAAISVWEVSFLAAFATYLLVVRRNG